jgi:ribonucleoside-triphosphate reductase
LVFSFPIDQSAGGSTRAATKVGLYEQAMLEIALARIWSDNSVSQTLYFNAEREGQDIERVLAQTCPMVKSLSMLPHCAKGVYKQSPYEEITEAEYHTMRSTISDIDWKDFTSEPVITRGCDGDNCEMRTFLASTLGSTSPVPLS